MIPRWSDVQRKRLAEERAILQRFFPKFRWISPAGDTTLEGPMQTNSGQAYMIRAYIPVDYPNSIPGVVVLSPLLTDHKGQDLRAQGMSTLMHILEPTQGNLTICHYRPEKWHPQITLYKVLVKVRLWLEAYEGHKASGKTMDDYLKHQP